MNSNSILYHGSTLSVELPLVHVGRKELDFGPGFYVTNIKDQAHEWARTLAGRKKNAKAVLNVYEFDYEGFLCDNSYRRLKFDSYSKEWLDFIAKSRKGLHPWTDFDWIEGGVANDKVITTVDAYVDGFITPEQAIANLKYADLNHQICILRQSIIDRYMHYLNTEIL